MPAHRIQQASWFLAALALAGCAPPLEQAYLYTHAELEAAIRKTLA